MPKINLIIKKSLLKELLPCLSRFANNTQKNLLAQ